MENREILFRAIAIHGNEWVYGNYIHSKRMSGRSCEYRMADKDTGLESDIIPETLGQFTGLLDKNGAKIFEGHIVQLESDRIDIGGFYHDEDQPGFMTPHGIITYASGKWYIEQYTTGHLFDSCPTNTVKTIGTIHDHLLKG